MFPSHPPTPVLGSVDFLVVIADCVVVNGGFDENGSCGIWIKFV